jgi:hypothetical protein
LATRTGCGDVVKVLVVVVAQIMLAQAKAIVICFLNIFLSLWLRRLQSFAYTPYLSSKEILSKRGSVSYPQNYGHGFSAPGVPYFLEDTKSLHLVNQCKTESRGSTVMAE